MTTLYYEVGAFSNVEFQIKIKRVGNTILNTVLVPGLALCYTCFLYVLIPLSSGERVAFLTTLLLTMVMFLVILNQFIPIARQAAKIELVFLTLTIVLSYMVVQVIIIDWFNY